MKFHSSELSVSPSAEASISMLRAIDREQKRGRLTKDVQFYLVGDVIATFHSVEECTGSQDRYHEYTVCLGLGLVLLCIRVPENCFRLNLDSNTVSGCQFTLRTNMYDHTHSVASFVGDFEGWPPETPEEWFLVSGGLVTNETDWRYHMMEQNTAGALREGEQVLMEETIVFTPRSGAKSWTPSHVD